MNKKIASEFAIGIILITAIVIGGIFYWQNQKISEVDNKQPEQKACTMEAKLCDDGTYVSRTGPNCEFTPCPTNNNQQTATDDQQISQMANPASTYCVENGGKSEIRTAVDGSQAGYCKFSDGSECEEWAYFRGECKKENLNESIIDTSNWQTYKNVEYGFEISFPNTWKSAKGNFGFEAHISNADYNFLSFHPDGTSSYIIDNIMISANDDVSSMSDTDNILGKNKNYFFNILNSNPALEEFIYCDRKNQQNAYEQARCKEVPNIIKTFKIIE